jgi:hypothetical protein
MNVTTILKHTLPVQLYSKDKMSDKQQGSYTKKSAPCKKHS